MKIDAVTTEHHVFGFSYPLHPYNAEVVEYCRKVHETWGYYEFRFDNSHSCWVFSDTRILEAITKRFPSCELTPEAHALLRAVAQESDTESARVGELTALKNATTSDIVIPGLKGELYPYQKIGVEFLLKAGGRAILADDPGLGKTVQTIGTILSLRNDGFRSLIVCPATMKYTWEMEVSKWSDMKAIVIDSKTIISEIPIDTDIWIVNYDLLKRHFTELMKVKFDLMALDESHYIKTENTFRSRIIRALSANIGYVLMLSGTPVLNRPVEIFNPLSILDPKEWNDWFRFAQRYCGAKRKRISKYSKKTILDVSGATNTAELKGKLDKYILRRRKEDVLKDLPEKIRIEIPVKLSPKEATIYDKAFRTFIKFLREDKNKNDAEVRRAMQAEKLVRINALREISALGKIDDAEEIISNIIEGGQKVIVFSSFVEPLRQLSHRFAHQCVLLTGETPSEDRFNMVKQFQEDDDTKVFLGGIKSAGVGITLTKASNVLFLDYSWTPADHKQAEDRAHRIGSTHDSINIYQMHAMGTMDDVMKNMLAKKRDVVEGLIGEGDDQSAMQMVLEELINNEK